MNILRNSGVRLGESSQTPQIDTKISSIQSGATKERFNYSI